MLENTKIKILNEVHPLPTSILKHPSTKHFFAVDFWYKLFIIPFFLVFIIILIIIILIVIMI